jgi:hypothetical protein
VRILSIRDAKHLNESQLRGALQYACRGSRADGSPRLKGLYIFTASELPGVRQTPRQQRAAAPTISIGWNQKSQVALHNALQEEGDNWYVKRGQIIKRHVADDWASTLVACNGIISFDAILCSGPRHINSPAYGRNVNISGPGQRHWAVATFSMEGCATCGSAPEGLTVHDETPVSQLPLLAPPPLLSSSLKSATQPAPHGKPDKLAFVARCAGCIKERYCGACHRWWCEDCYQLPGAIPHGAHEHAEPPVVEDDDSDGLQGFKDMASKVKVRQGLCEQCILGELLDAQLMMRT